MNATEGWARTRALGAAVVLVACGSHGEERTGQTSAALSPATTYPYDVNGVATISGAPARVLDALGRVVEVGGRSFTYGPDGQVATVTREGAAGGASYLYDETGARLVKSIDGSPDTAFIDGVYLSATEVAEPIEVEGRLVGLLRNGAFSLVAADLRGTVQADTDGTPRLASPYGDRDVQPDVAPIADYAARGHDADLDAIRMGVRDYQASSAGFLQPDPLFLEHPERCVGSAVECNLYGYAANAPLDFVDPSGTEATAEPSPPETHESLDQMLGDVQPTSREEALALVGIDTVHSIFEPGDQIEVAPGPPGTHEASRDAAAYVALTYYNTRSIAQNREYAGVIYQNKDSSFSYTAAARGYVDHSYPHNTEDGVPVGAKIVGWYHTHGGPDPRYDGEHFSSDDRDVTHEDQKPGYVISPTWHFGILHPTLPRTPNNQAIGDVCRKSCDKAQVP